MFTSFKNLFTPNVVPRSIRYYQKVKPINKVEYNQPNRTNRRHELCDALKTVLGTRKCLTVDEWKEFRSKAKIQKIISNDKDILTAIKSLDNSNDPLQIAESFVQAFDIDRDVTVNSTFIDLYAAKAAEGKLTQIEENDLIKICNELVEKGIYLLPSVFVRVCNGFCATKEWKRILGFPKMYESPATINLVIRKALHENESKLGWELIKNLTTHYPNELHENTIAKYLHFSAKNNSQTPEYVEKMLQLLEKNECNLFEPVAKTLIDILRESNCDANQIRMDFSGICPNCAKSLAQSTITEEEFALVIENFEKKVVHGENIYLKTTPNEWNAFKELIDKKGPFDIVVDGLNVAFHSNKKKHCSDANKLIDAVLRLEEGGKRVLVIGRKLMEQWQGIERLKTLSSNIFLVENVSKDDIFLLYGAMHSGPNAHILSNDYMRDHKHLMGPEYKSLFKKWQQQSALSFFFDKNDQFHTMQPMKFKSFCQQNDGHWHVPFIGDDERNQFNEYTLMKNWICLRL